MQSARLRKEPPKSQPKGKLLALCDWLLQLHQVANLLRIRMMYSLTKRQLEQQIAGLQPIYFYVLEAKSILQYRFVIKQVYVLIEATNAITPQN
jgi:hypothetical protein